MPGGMPINTGSFSNLLLAGWLRKTWQAGMADWSTKYTRFMTIVSSKQAFEQYQETMGLGLVPKKNEGAPTQLQGTNEGFFNIITNVSWSLGFMVTQEMKMDDKYNFIAQLPKGLARSMKQTIEVSCANLINNGFSTSFPIYDGQPLFSNAHPLASGSTFSNTFGALDLGETALITATSQINRAVDNRGLVALILPKMLIVPPELEARASKLLYSTLEPESGNNAINYVTQKGIFPGGFEVNPYFTDPDAWLVKTDQEGLIYQDRYSPEMTNDNDFLSGNDLSKVYCRFGLGVTDFRAGYASSGGTGPLVV